MSEILKLILRNDRLFVFHVIGDRDRLDWLIVLHLYFDWLSIFQLACYSKTELEQNKYVPF
jgi:hypothetical protein